jgi:EmrB/QacA subfamily drug resistance transporter
MEAGSATARTPPRGGKWGVVIALASAQFIMVLDSTVMNVSIQDVIDDLDTTVSRMQLAIAAYTLCMAALMMLGGKIGDVIGRRLAFRIGLVLFGVGAGITAAAPNVGVLIAGWSVVEAVGAALMIPAVAALIASNYSGRDRAICFGIIGGVVGAAAAAGPIIGGWVSTEFSWRLVFAAETVIVVVLLVASRLIRDHPRRTPRPRLDGIGATLSGAGLALVVLGIVASTDWGWVEPKGALTVAGTEITPFGLSVVPFLIVVGLFLLGAFADWERRVSERGGDPLVRLEMLRIPRLRAGLMTMAVMMLTMGGIFFVLPLYLQIVLGKDPLDTGIHILPLSIAVFFVALVASRLSSRVAPRRIVRLGMVAILAGSLLLLATIEPALDALEFGVAMAIIGVGLGMMASQLGNINLSSVPATETSEVGGLQGTAQNLGTALGTALIGAILLTSLTGAFDRNITDNPDLPGKVRNEVAAQTQAGIPFLPASQARSELERRGVSDAETKALTETYADAELTALKAALGGVAAIVVLSFWATRRLPAEPLPASDGDPGAAGPP